MTALRKKLLSLLLLAVAAVACYFCLLNGGAAMVWTGLGLIMAASLLLYVNC